MRLNTEPYEIEYRKDTEAWHLSGPGITTETTRQSRYEAEQLAYAMATAYKAGVEQEKSIQQIAKEEAKGAW